MERAYLLLVAVVFPRNEVLQVRPGGRDAGGGGGGGATAALPLLFFALHPLSLSPSVRLACSRVGDPGGFDLGLMGWATLGPWATLSRAACTDWT